MSRLAVRRIHLPRAHHPVDIQSRSKNVFDITLDVNAIPWHKVHVQEYRFDKDNNSYYSFALELRDRPAGKQICYSAGDAARLQQLSTLHVTGDSHRDVSADGTLRLRLTVAANGANFVVIEPAANY